MLALEDLLEAAHRLAPRHVLAFATGEPLGDAEGLRQESLHLARPRYRLLVVFRQLLHAEDGDYVLQVLVALHDLLHALGRVVVILADDGRLHEPARRSERVDRRIDPDLDERAFKTKRCAEVGEHGLDRGVGVVVGRHVHRLHRRDRALPSRRDPFLELAHLRGEGWLIPDGRRHASQKRGHLRAGEEIAEDVVDEEQRVRALFVAEVFGHGQTCQPDTRPCPGRFVHLAEDQRGLRQHAGVLHLDVHVVAFARPLPHSRENRAALVLVSDVADELLDDDRLARAGASEQPDLRALGERADQVDDLDPRLEDLDLGLLLRNRRRGTMDRPARGPFRRGLVVDRVADDVEQPA